MRQFILLPFLLVIGLMMSFREMPAQSLGIEPFTVVLDAGHGGHDPGNLGNGYMEKNISLNIVLEVGKLLERQPDIRVVYTRKDDSFVDLFLRGKIANDADADLFVSVHCDSHSSDAHGAGTFVLGLHANEQNFEIAKKENSVIYLEDDYETRYAEYDINSPESVIGLTIMQEEFLDQSIALAKMMQDEFSGRLKRNDRKVKQAGFIVLHQTFMPSVLVETGFLTNKNEGTYLNSSKGQLEMGRAIADAIISYKQNVRSQPGTLIASTVAAVDSTPAASADKPEKEIIAASGTTDIPEIREYEEPENDTEAEKSELAAVEKEIKTEKTIVDTSPAPGVGIAEEESATSDKVLAMATEPTVKSKELQPVPAVEEIPASDPPAEKEANVVFKVQLLASSREIPLRPSNFKGLGRLSKEPYKNLFRYFYGSTGSYSEAQMLKSNADIKGYSTSFIVAYKDGVRIPVEEAMKYVSD